MWYEMSKVFGKWAEEHEADIEELKYTFRRMRQNPLSLLGLSIFVVFVFLAVFAPYVSPYDPIVQSLPERLQPPSVTHLFGTDELGRDLFSRVLWGARISLWMGIMVIAISVSVGTVVGVLAGYLGGRFDELFMRITDMFLAFPMLILAMAIAAALGNSLENTMLAISITSWPRYARLMRAQTLSVKEQLYVEAARSVGASKTRIVFKYILPNCLAPIIIQSSLRMGGTILAASGLGFIGFGARPPTPEWGVMISQGRRYIMGQWWISVFPGLAIFIVVLGLNFLGDSLRDILDPRLRRG